MRISQLTVPMLTASIALAAVPHAHAFQGAQDAASTDPLAATTVAVIGEGMCTGTVIAPEWVITAAHCDITTSDVVYVGAQASTSIAHSVIGATSNDLYDVTLVRVGEPITEVAPAALYNKPELAPAGTPTQAYGWGRGNSVHNIPAWEQVQTTPGALVDEAPIALTTRPDMVGVVNDYAGNARAIPGDSGGPLFVDGELYGVLSGGPLEQPEDAFLGDPVNITYSPVAKFRSWIAETTGIALTTDTPTDPAAVVDKIVDTPELGVVEQGTHPAPVEPAPSAPTPDSQPVEPAPATAEQPTSQATKRLANTGTPAVVLAALCAGLAAAGAMVAYRRAHS